jgi:hypothetical protein
MMAAADSYEGTLYVPIAKHLVCYTGNLSTQYVCMEQNRKLGRPASISKAIALRRASGLVVL